MLTQSHRTATEN